MSRRYANDRDRITQNVRIDDETGCWIWQLAPGRDGYGRAELPGGRRASAHRLSYETFVGVIPDGLQIDHLCRVRRCVNPEHLEPVTLAENLRRSPLTFQGRNIVKTHCPAGHPYDEVHTKWWQGKRSCRTCSNDRKRASRAALRSA